MDGIPPDAYAGSNGYWLCLVKLANLLPSAGGEHEQIASSLRKLARDQIEDILADEGVDNLLSLDPPLETVLWPREESRALQVAKALARVRNRRRTDSKAAVLALFEVLQAIRDKREHGFKAPGRPRDSIILGATTSILRRVCLAIIEYVSAATETAHGA